MTPIEQVKKPYLTMEECTALLGVSASRVQQLLTDGRLKPVYQTVKGRQGRNRHISYDSVRKFATENQTTIK